MRVTTTKSLLNGLILLAFFACALPVLGNFSQAQKVTSVPRGVGAQFGNAIAIDGNTMVVGARFDSTTASQAGAAYVYVLSGKTWTQQAVLLANDGAVADKFGYSVAISGDTIVVGAYNDDSPQSNAGSAYVFVRSGTTWTQQQKLTASDAHPDEEFGNAVAITGNTIFVGEHFADLPGNSEAGATYVFKRSGTVWSQMQKLVPAGGVILGDHFGESLAISGDKLVIGSPGADIPFTAAGSVYVFLETGGSYIQQDKISIPDGKNGDSFGFSVAIEGTTLVGGALQWTPNVAQPAYGAAYVFEFNGSAWISQGRLTASDGATVDRFGYSVAVHNNIIAVGAREDDTTVGGDAGSAYVFKRSGVNWTEQQKLDPDDSFNGDRFGVSVAWTAGGMLVVGAAEKALTSPNGQGAVYTFTEGRPVFPDFDGDKKADLSYFNNQNGQWWFTRSSDNTVGATTFGTSTDLMAPGDYDGDGKTDIAIFRPATGEWFWLNSSDSIFHSAPFGTAGDLPMPGDYDGDGKVDLCVFRPSTGEWQRLNSSNGQSVITPFGVNGDIPLLGDFDGDGKTDISIFRSGNGAWYVLPSSNGSYYVTQFGVGSDIPAPADYDGDGKTDIAIFRPSGGTWFVLNSTSGFTATSFGAYGDKPVPADYDGDGKADLAVFRPSDGNWFINRSTSGISIQQFGTADSQPVPLFFVRQALTLSSVQFSASTFSANEGSSTATINVTRSGNTSTTVSVDYASSDGIATQLTDYTRAVGTITFGPGETSKSFTVLLIDDVYVEGNETVNLTLNNPAGSTVLGSQTTAVLTITDNDVAAPTTNPLDNSDAMFFVREHYLDFLNREPDPGGLSYWASQISSCGSDQACIKAKRLDVSNAFFYELEFQQTGAYVYRLYRAAYGNDQPLPNTDPGNPAEAKKIPRYDVFAADRASIVAGTNQAQGQLDLANNFVQRLEFVNKYSPNLTGPQFVDALLARISSDSGSNLTSQRSALIDLFNASGRGAVLYRLADDNATNPINNRSFIDAEYNRSFVYTQYAGYLRRDSDIGGFLFWLDKVNAFPIRNAGIQHVMVCAFITSAEYQQRFSSVVTRGNSECQ